MRWDAADTGHALGDGDAGGGVLGRVGPVLEYDTGDEADHVGGGGDVGWDYGLGVSLSWARARVGGDARVGTRVGS